jgi:hypothetical protein
VSVVESEPLPEVAVTTIGYVPAGVPMPVLTDGAAGPITPPQAIMPAAITSNETIDNVAVNRGTGLLKTRRLNHASTITRPTMYITGQCDEGVCGDLKGGRVECAIVAIESVTVEAPLPAGMLVEGEKEGIAPIGNPDAVSDTAFAVVVFAGTTIRSNFASWPATTEMLGTGTLSLKSSFTVNVATTDGLPPGFATVTKGVPATAMALAGIAACKRVALTNDVETEMELKVTAELTVNPVPTIWSVNPGPPAVALAGCNAPITGCVFVGRIVRVTGDEVPPALPPPAGSVTEILIVP